MCYSDWELWYTAFGMADLPEDIPRNFRLVALSGNTLGHCSLAPSWFGSRAKSIIAEMLQRRVLELRLIGTTGEVQDEDML